MKFNTAIAALMTMINEFAANGVTKGDMKALALLLSPFAPHICEEMWQMLGGEGLVCQHAWPDYDESKTVESEKEIAVQVNGKLKTTIIIPADSADEAIVAAACADEKIKRIMEGMQLVKTIVVKNKIVNLIIKPAN